MADVVSSLEEDTIRSLRTSPINACSNDRTSIEDFEIIKPISRGAFGRVLKKANMICKNSVESILAERNILIFVHNPFVLTFRLSKVGLINSTDLSAASETKDAGDEGRQRETSPEIRSLGGCRQSSEAAAVTTPT
ncbi:hypothetical protein L484_018120 [Morus notabilis]|uniref:Protein kinase domain-containing protein n=1 Tax=Morus notabilis TaxID=981085 RepID=W9R3C8_9ROSA|nr:hypothetical protein L484_018120 [Morus notabilis]